MFKPNPVWLLPSLSLGVGLALPAITEAGPTPPFFQPNLQQVGLEGDWWYNYDLNDDSWPTTVDMPVNMVWGAEGKVTWVKTYLDGLGGWHLGGSPKHTRIHESDHPHPEEFDGDNGVKGPCESSTVNIGKMNMHTRIYAPDMDPSQELVDQFFNITWGFYVLGTSHYDTNHGQLPFWPDPCGSETEQFGWSEQVELRIANAADADYLTHCQTACDLGYRLDTDMENPGDDWQDINHFHNSDGVAAFVYFKSPAPCFAVDEFSGFELPIPCPGPF